MSTSSITLWPRQNGRHFADGSYKYIFFNTNFAQISLKFVPEGPINNILASVWLIAWRCPDNKPLYEPMIVSLLTHICVARPQWVKLEFNTVVQLSPVTAVRLEFTDSCIFIWNTSTHCGLYYPGNQYYILPSSRERAPVVNIIPRGKQGRRYPMQYILWLLMAW